MKHKIIFIISVMMLLSCQKDLDHWIIDYPIEVSEGVAMFKDYAPSNVKAKRLTIILVGRPIQYADGMAAGLTRYKEKTITLDTTSSQWQLTRNALILHELGHYVLYRGHTEDVNSLMNPWYFPEEVTNTHMKELFNF